MLRRKIYIVRRYVYGFGGCSTAMFVSLFFALVAAKFLFASAPLPTNPYIESIYKIYNPLTTHPILGVRKMFNID